VGLEGKKLEFVARKAEIRTVRQAVSVLKLGLAQSRLAKLYKNELSYEVLRPAVK
jgi:hypothetical protein